MPLGLRSNAAPGSLIVIVLILAAMLLACRALGFGAGVLLGATPASGLALAVALIWRGRGALAVMAGFALAGAVAGLPAGAVAIDAVAHGLAALLAATVMRGFARRHAPEPMTKTEEWLVFLAGTVTFAGMVAAIFAFGLIAGPLAAEGQAAPLRAAAFEPLGIATCFAMLASLGEWRSVQARPEPAFGILALAGLLLGVLGLLLALPSGRISPSGVTLMLSVPFCLWVAMQRRSLDGAAIAFLAAHVALVMGLHAAGSVVAPDYVTTIVYLTLLVATCQLVHAVNLDRLGAYAAIEAHKRGLEARVAERTARLSAMTERALAADAAKTRFLAAVSHEVRTPLNGVIGMASVVLEADLDPGTRRNVEVIRSSGFHLLDVINRILDFSRLDHGASPEDIVTFDLQVLVREVLAEARFLPAARGLTLRAAIGDIEPLRTGYRQGLRQILTNLVGNAAKFTPSGGVVVRAADLPDGRLRIEVEDSGIGISAEACTRIFLPFEQADGTMTRRFGGTGLGLAICAELVRRMQGSIGVESVPETGSTFWVELPLPATASQAIEVAAER